MSTYREAGVDIDAGQKTVELMAAAVRSTYGPEVLSHVGSFGGLYDAGSLKELERPVLVASTDGVGTKVMLATRAGRYEGLGHDIVNHCVNDILVQGARPLFFLDYLASSRLEPEKLSRVVIGMAEACRANGCALLGGETAEMPGVYRDGEFDIAGTIVGVVERGALLPRADLAAGDVLVGLASSGPHTNGYSLLRRVFAEVPLEHVYPELGVPLAEALLAPHRSYLGVIPLGRVKALAHITGGGLTDNLPRIGRSVRLGSWPVPPLFELVAERGGIPPEEMLRVFNQGIGMVAVVDPAEVEAFQAEVGERTWVIGEVT